jgi:hypothetical protein
MVTSDKQGMDLYPLDYISSLESSFIPGHLLYLKNGCIMMCLRNVSPEAGCYNGTIMIVNDVWNGRILRCTIINGINAGEDISIPRIKLRPQDLINQPCEWDILQFPVRLAYTTTITKAKAKEVWLVTVVFCHGQLYVAVSRTGTDSSVMFAVMP